MLSSFTEKMEIEVGCFYKLDHSKLPSSIEFPASLSSIKAVLVDNIRDEDVTVVFPSNDSVKSFFGCSKKENGLVQPKLDENFVMSLNVGKKLLTQKISFDDFTAKRGMRNFWVVFDDDDDNDGVHDDDVDDGVHDDDDEDYHHMSNGGLEIKWEKRRRTTLYGKQRTNRRKKMNILKCMVKGEASMAEDDDDVGEEKEIPENTRTLRKRKCQFKGVKYREIKKKKKQIREFPEKKFKDHQHRWTLERYKLAEKNMLKILKEKGAGPGNPILRPDLRTEARKLIGDTGLLDHLLKHMAGKLAPGGKERFRRRHNPEGAMEYWLESADLIEIRKQAGVEDPYWVPPPGWEPGDCPNQDPVCGMQLKELKDEVADMRRELEKLVCKEKGNNLKKLNVAPISIEGSLNPLKALHDELMKKKSLIEKQLLDISKSYFGMEEEIGRLKESFPEEKEGKDDELAQEDNAKTTGAINEPEISQDNKEEQQMIQHKKLSAAEKRQKLKSGFRICKPQGTFLWPSQMDSSSTTSKVVFHFEDLIGYPTPPSVCSSSCKPPSFMSSLPSPPPPPPCCHQPRVKKPVATRPALTLNFSIATIRGSTTIESISSPTTTTASGCSSTVHHTFVPDLNEVPLSSLT